MFDHGVLRVWHLARCDGCLFTLSFDREPERDEWAAEHSSATGHRVRRGIERRWREATVIGVVCRRVDDSPAAAHDRSLR